MSDGARDVPRLVPQPSAPAQPPLQRPESVDLQAQDDPLNSARVELLFSYLDNVYDRERQRLRWAEEKISRYLQVVGLIVVGGAAAAPTAKLALTNIGRTEYALFLLAFTVAFLAAAVAVAAAAVVGKVSSTSAMPFDERTVNVFLHAPLQDIANGAASTYRACITDYHRVNASRFTATAWVYYATCTAIAAGLIALATYTFILP